jgi:uncharacterized membrane protein
MNDVPIQIIVAAFKEETAADEALQTLKEAKKERLIGIQDAAILRRDEKNQLHIKETADLGGGKGATIGGVLGGVIGLIGGPAGVVLGGAAGAAVGGLAAKLFDAGISDDRLEEIGKGLKPGTSAIIAIIEHKWVAEIEEQLALAGADVLTEALRDDIAEQLAKGKDVMYSALGTQEGVSAASIVTESGAESGNQETQPNQQADTQ